MRVTTYYQDGTEGSQVLMGLEQSVMHNCCARNVVDIEAGGL
jgi:hypothetical protein